jgi:hypothetical protein
MKIKATLLVGVSALALATASLSACGNGDEAGNNITNANTVVVQDENAAANDDEANVCDKDAVKANSTCK